MRVYVSFDFTFTQRENAYANLLVNGYQFSFNYNGPENAGQWAAEYGWSDPNFAIGLLRVVSNGNVDSVYGFIDCPEGYVVQVGNIQWTNELIVGSGFCGSFSKIQLSTSQDGGGADLTPLLIIGGLGIAGAVAYYLWKKKSR